MLGSTNKSRFFTHHNKSLLVKSTTVSVCDLVKFASSCFLSTDFEVDCRNLFVSFAFASGSVVPCRDSFEALVVTFCDNSMGPIEVFWLAKTSDCIVGGAEGDDNGEDDDGAGDGVDEDEDEDDGDGNGDNDWGLSIVPFPPRTATAPCSTILSSGMNFLVTPSSMYDDM